MPGIIDRAAQTRRVARIVLGVVFVVLWFALIEQRALWEPDEGRYAEIPREMVASGDWITPRLNGLLYFEKPPLQYWMTAVAYELFGLHNWTARLWPLLTGLAGLVFAWYAGRRLYSARAGTFAAAILASSMLYFAAAHFNTLDMGLAFFLETVVFALALAWQPQAALRAQRLWIHVAWAAAALALLTKGLIGVVLPGAAVVAYSLVYRDFTIWKKLAPLTGVPLLMLIAAPWFLTVTERNPDFAWFFFVHEHFTRYLTTEHQRFVGWWFFVPILAIGALPWTLPAAAGLWRALRAPRARPGFDASRFLAVWSLVVFGFFSASHSKLALYILPIVPALAVLAARYLSEAPRDAVRRQFAYGIVVSLILLLVAVFSGHFADAERPADMTRAQTTWLVAAGAVWAAGSVVAFFAHATRGTDSAIIALALAVMLAHQIILVAFDKLSPEKSSFLLAQQLKPQIGEGTTVYSVSTYPQSLPYYLGRTVTLVNYEGELAFGIRHEPEKAIYETPMFIQRWQNDTDAVAVMSRERHQKLTAAGVPMRTIAEDTVRIAVRR